MNENLLCKRSTLVNRRNIELLHDNVKLHSTRITLEKISDFGWFGDFHSFSFLQNALNNKKTFLKIGWKGLWKISQFTVKWFLNKFYFTKTETIYDSTQCIMNIWFLYGCYRNTTKITHRSKIFVNETALKLFQRIKKYQTYNYYYY